MNPPAPLKTFIIYARSDEAYKRDLLLHLRPLLNSRLLSVWHDGNILPGEDWQTAIKKELSSSDLVLMLVSAHSLNSEFIQGQELRTALDRLRAGLTRVVPVIVSPCGWRFDPVLAGLQALPLFGGEGPKPVNDRVWQNTDEAWANVVENLGSMAIELNEKRNEAIAALAAEKEAERRKAEQQLENDRAATELQRAKEAEASRLHAEEAHVRAEQAREREQHDAHNAAWAAASAQHDTNAYEQFLSIYPGSANAREARHRIKMLRQAERTGTTQTPRLMTWGKWTGIGVAILAVVLLVWNLYPATDGKTPTNPNTMTTGDTLRPKDAVPVSDHPGQGSLTISPENQPDNGEMKKEGSSSTPATEPKPAFTFNYPIIRVAGGAFLMGSPAKEANRQKDECQHSVTVGAFGIGQTEVTQAQWQSVMGSNPSRFKGDNLPVENVSWNDVQAFIKKLNDKTGQHFRLPTENEWEYAARGGNRSGGYTYAGSNNLDEVAWYGYEKAGKTTHPVGTKKANELGLYDMSGNVWEWCQDYYGPYAGCQEPERVSSNRVLRGGSWFDNGGFCRSAFRSNNVPDLRYFYFGFRLAQD